VRGFTGVCSLLLVCGFTGVCSLYLCAVLPEFAPFTCVRFHRSLLPLLVWGFTGVCSLFDKQTLLTGFLFFQHHWLCWDSYPQLAECKSCFLTTRPQLLSISQPIPSMTTQSSCYKLHTSCSQILTIRDPGKVTADEMQGRMLLHTEYSLLSLLHNQPGVVHCHGFFRVSSRVFRIVKTDWPHICLNIITLSRMLQPYMQLS